MTDTQPLQPPSWALPILIGATATLIVQGLPSLLTLFGGTEGYAMGVSIGCCCGSVGSLPLGFVTALVAFRRDRTLLPIHGFSVAFIAVGLGQVGLAAFQYVLYQNVDLDELEVNLRTALNETLQQQANPPAAAEIEAAVAQGVELMQWLPIATAGVATLLAATIGMLSITFLRSRQRVEAP